MALNRGSRVRHSARDACELNVYSVSSLETNTAKLCRAHRGVSTASPCPKPFPESWSSPIASLMAFVDSKSLLYSS
eukprot:8436488-Pyramimonas_sp.AAC.1